MSSGQPPSIRARLSRALLMSSFAFLPAEPDLAAPAGSHHHGASPGSQHGPSWSLPAGWELLGLPQAWHMASHTAWAASGASGVVAL